MALGFDTHSLQPVIVLPLLHVSLATAKSLKARSVWPTPSLVMAQEDFSGMAVFLRAAESGGGSESADVSLIRM